MGIQSNAALTKWRVINCHCTRMNYRKQMVALRMMCHDFYYHLTQHNDNQHNESQHNDNQHNDIQCYDIHHNTIQRFTQVGTNIALKCSALEEVTNTLA
jgi:hypothetical protein